MARTAVPVSVVPAESAGSPTPFAEQAADVSNYNCFPLTGREILIARNSGESAYTVTVNSVADTEGRIGDITALSIAAGDVVVFPQFSPEDWMQTDGTLHFQASNDAVMFLVVQVP